MSACAAPEPICRATVSCSLACRLKLVSFNDLAPLPAAPVPAAERAAALQAIQEEIGDCTRCPLAYAGRHKIVFGDGSPTARLMFVGEGPGADEDAQGLPFVGKAGQLLNNMIAAMGLEREEVYIANIVKCRPPGNRVPEPVEANTCSQFLLRQIDVVQPEVIVALGSTAATYLLGVKQSLSSLRGRLAYVPRGEAGGDVSSGVSAARSAAEGGGVEGPADGDGGVGAEGAGEEVGGAAADKRQIPGFWLRQNDDEPMRGIPMVDCVEPFGFAQGRLRAPGFGQAMGFPAAR